MTLQEGPATEGAQRQIDEIKGEVRYALKAMAVAGFLFFVSVVVAVVSIDNVATEANKAIEAAEAERQSRVESVSGVVQLFCDINNEQDAALADLVEVSVASGTNTFGSTVDPADLSAFDLEVVGAIETVQRLEAQNAEAPSDLFTQKLKELRDLTPCQQIVSLYLAGGDVPTLKELNATTSD